MKNIILLLLLNLLVFSNLNAAESIKNIDTDKRIKTKPIAPIYIDVNDIAKSAIDVDKSIKEAKEELIENTSTIEMYKKIKPYHKNISDLLSNNKYANILNQNPRQLQKMQSEVSIHIKQLEEWENNLKFKITLYIEKIEILKAYVDLWEETKKNAIKNEAPKEIVSNISSVLLNIKNVSKEIKNKYDNILITSQKLTITISKLQNVNNNLKESESLFKNKIFYQDKELFFTSVMNEKFLILKYFKNIKNVIFDKNKEVMSYLNSNTDILVPFLLLLLVSAGFIFYFYKLYKKKTLFIDSISYEKKEYYFILRPLSTLIMIAMMFISAFFENRPDSFTEVQLYIIIIPSILIVLSTLNKEFHKYIYSFFILYILFRLNANAIDFEIEGRLVSLILNIIFIIYYVKIIREHIYKVIDNSIIQKIAFYFMLLSVLALIVSLVSNVYGSVLLSATILNIVIYVFYASIIFYTLYILLRGYAVVILRRRISSASYMLEKYSNNIESTVKILISLWMTLWWLLVVFKSVGVYPYIINIREFVLETSWAVGQTVISVQSIVDFFTIAFFTWLIAKLIKIVLEVEIFARFKLPRGVPTAILTTLNYFIIIIGTVLALSSLGISSQQFTLVFGALGVGIGFGLRNIIANFVSGIILVFERPVQIGDTIEINNTFGDIQSIGARSSTIRTYDGSEVVIPNADFMSKDIINWTYSEVDRRKDITFRVDIDNDVDIILNLMTSVALSHTDIICQTEELMPTLSNIGEYYLEFKLYFWLKEDVVRAKSKINVSLYKALKEAGIKMPVQKFNRT